MAGYSSSAPQGPMSEPQRQFESDRVSELTRRADLWQRRYRALLESLDDAILIYDESGNIVTVNTAAESLSGMVQEELLRANVRDLLGPGCLERTAAHENFTAEA